MGGTSSKYKLTVANTVANKNLDWVASPTTKIVPMKGDAFYNVLGLGKGKFGMVFLAKQSARDSAFHVAIKYVPKQTILEFQNAAKMQQEISALQQCDHPFIAHFFGGYETPTCICLVLEFAYGGELYHRLQKVHRMSESEAKFYFCELASALRYLHEDLNIAYRDLKPENILLDKEGHVRLCDFGFATPIDPGQIGGAAPLQDGCGTVMYMAPELVGKSLQTTHGYPVDWWALGCVLMEMITGDAPFGNSENMSKFEIFNNISEKAVSLPFLMSGSLKALVRGLLEKNDKKRFDFEQVSKSSWIKEVNWEDLENRRIKPPWVPEALDIAVSAPNFISWDKLALPTGNPSSNALSYCKDIKFPAPRVSTRTYSNTRKSAATAGAAGANNARLQKQNSKKIVPTEGGEGDAGAGLDSPAVNPAAKKRPDSIMVAKDRNKAKEANSTGSGASTASNASAAATRERTGSNKNMDGSKPNDSAKITRERSKASIKRDVSIIKE